MHYDDDFEFPVPEELTLAELLATLEDEVFIVASLNENYLDTWRALTPESALAFLRRRRGDIDERCLWHFDNFDETYAEAAPTFLRTLCRIAQEVENALHALTTDMSSSHPVGQVCPPSHLNSISESKEYEAWTPAAQASFEKMLTAALAVRRVKPVAPACETMWTSETSKAIEEIRASTFAGETVFPLNHFALPSALRTSAWRNQLAIKVPSEWLARYESYVTHEPPVTCLVRRPNAELVLALELASGTVRLDASNLAEYLREFDTELPVLFIGQESCCLAIHRFTALVDGATIEDFVKHRERRKLLPMRDKLAVMNDGSVVEALERKRPANPP